MEFYKEILSKILENESIQVDFPNLKISATEILESESYKALQKIKAVIENDSLEDSECFAKIEEIIRVFEKMGASGGNRHDFG